MRHLLLLFLLSWSVVATSQTISSVIPEEVNKSGKYLFYLHGQIVTDLGNNAVSQAFPEWGTYEYHTILDSLQGRGFNVISERRLPEIADSVYVNKVSKQVDSLLQAGVKPKNILILGASAGWNIGIRVSNMLKNKKLSYVIMGGCWPDTYKNYIDLKLYGRFLSVIEATDPHGTCHQIFEGRKGLKYKEITLHTGRSHGFIFKGDKAWIDPVINWFGEK